MRESKQSLLYHAIYFTSIVFIAFALGYAIYSGFSKSVKFEPRSSLMNFFIGITVSIIISKVILALLFLFIDASRLLFFTTDKVIKVFNPNLSPITLEGRRKFLIQIGLALAAIPFGSFLYGITKGKYNYKVHKVKLYFDNLDPVFNGYKIVQISDIHAGSFDSPEQVQKGIDLINEQEADLFLFTGDLVNDRAEEMDAYASTFASINAKDGKYSITGNHDYGDYFPWEDEKSKQENFERFVLQHQKIGFKLLRNEHVKIQKKNAHFNLVGIENWGLPPFPQHGDMQKATAGISNEFSLLMSHDPSHWDAQTNKNYKNINLTLSGHTHGMQFGIEIPGIKWSPVKYRYPKWAGLYKTEQQYLYVNRGFGFLGLPGRVGIWPEITVIELYSKQS